MTSVKQSPRFRKLDFKDYCRFDPKYRPLNFFRGLTLSADLYLSSVRNAACPTCFTEYLKMSDIGIKAEDCFDNVKSVFGFDLSLLRQIDFRSLWNKSPGKRSIFTGLMLMYFNEGTDLFDEIRGLAKPRGHKGDVRVDLARCLSGRAKSGAFVSNFALCRSLKSWERADIRPRAIKDLIKAEHHHQAFCAAILSKSIDRNSFEALARTHPFLSKYRSLKDAVLAEDLETFLRACSTAEGTGIEIIQILLASKLEDFIAARLNK